MSSNDGRWRISPTAALIGTLAVLALGGSAAFASSHFIITSKSQIKPTVLKALRGAKGPPGATGATGAAGAAGAAGKNGTDGTNGNTGPQGPGASVLSLTLYSPGALGTQTLSAAVGTIPVQLGCTNAGSSAPTADLYITANSTSSRQARYDATWVTPAVGTTATQPTVFQTNGTFPLSGTTDVLSLANAGDVKFGAIYVHEPVSSGSSDVTETVNFELTVGGANAGSACGISAQIVASS
jgi:hypothetical protein